MTTLEIMLSDDTPVGFIVAATCVPRVGETIWLRDESREQKSWRVEHVAYWADTTHKHGLAKAAVYVQPVETSADK